MEGATDGELMQVVEEVVEEVVAATEATMLIVEVVELSYHRFLHRRSMVGILDELVHAHDAWSARHANFELVNQIRLLANEGHRRVNLARERYLLWLSLYDEVEEEEGPDPGFGDGVAELDEEEGDELVATTERCHRDMSFSRTDAKDLITWYCRRLGDDVKYLDVGGARVIQQMLTAYIQMN